MKYLFDNNMSPNIAKALDALCEPKGCQVVHLRDKFRADISDVDWINVLSSEGDWIIISKDRFNKNSIESEALRRSGLVAFILKKQWSNISMWEQAYMLIRWWPRIMEQADLVENGAFFVPYRFSGKGKFEQAVI